MSFVFSLVDLRARFLFFSFSLSLSKKKNAPSLEDPRGAPSRRHLHRRVRGRSRSSGGERGDGGRRRRGRRRRRRFRRLCRRRCRALASSASACSAPVPAPSRRRQVRLPDRHHRRPRVCVPQQACRRVDLEQRPRLLEEGRLAAARDDDVEEVEPERGAGRRVDAAAEEVAHDDVCVVPEGVGGEEDPAAGVAKGSVVVVFLREKRGWGEKK